MIADVEKFSRAIREILRVNKAQGFAIGGAYEEQDTSDFAHVHFPEDGGVPDLSIPDAAFQLDDCARACVPDFKWEYPYQQLGDWMGEPDGRGAIIFGSPGAGKTFLVTVYAALAYMHCGALFTIVTAQELNDVADKVKRDRFLIVDDIGMEEERRVYGNHSYVLPDLIDMAERRNNILVLTTNLTAGQLVAKYGTRATDRMRGLCRGIDFNGVQSHRSPNGRFVIPVPKQEAVPERITGPDALKAYLATIPEEEKLAMEPDQNRVGEERPKHPLVHFLQAAKEREEKAKNKRFPWVL